MDRGAGEKDGVYEGLVVPEPVVTIVGLFEVDKMAYGVDGVFEGVICSTIVSSSVDAFVGWGRRLDSSGEDTLVQQLSVSAARAPG